MQKILGLKPKYFRPPYGSYSDTLLSVLAARGYTKLILWSEDTGDANGESPDYSKGVWNNVGNSDGHIVLSHDPIASTVYDVTPHALAVTGGLQKVSVDTCLGNQGEWPYYYVGEPGQRDGSWTC